MHLIKLALAVCLGPNDRKLTVNSGKSTPLSQRYHESLSVAVYPVPLRVYQVFDLLFLNHCRLTLYLTPKAANNDWHQLWYQLFP